MCQDKVIHRKFAAFLIFINILNIVNVKEWQEKDKCNKDFLYQWNYNQDGDLSESEKNEFV